MVIKRVLRGIWRIFGREEELGEGFPFDLGVMMYGEKVREMRRARGMKISELSQRSGVSRAQISRIENGKIGGSREELERLWRGARW